MSLRLHIVAATRCEMSLCLHIVAATLIYQISNRLFSKEQVHVLTDGLMKAFCYKDMNVSTVEVSLYNVYNCCGVI